MAYGLKYLCGFDRVSTTSYLTYRLEIYQKDFVGYETDIIGGVSVAIHTYETDDPQPPIKGSSLSVTVINENGSISLLDLYSDDDEEFKVKLVWEGPSDVTLFEGYLVQDDSSEPMVDYNHEITISATDNLGLLKDIAFDKASYQAGDFYTLRSLLSVIRTCLTETGLGLHTKVFAAINESTQDDTVCFLEQTLIDPQTFNQGNNTWDNCYSVLEKILTRFGLTLFQAEGSWFIVRLADLRYFDYDVPGFEYDSDFTLLGTLTYDNGRSKWPIGIGERSQVETGFRGGITRSYKFTKETFNYRQPDQLLRNFDLQQTGALLNTYLDGSNTVNEYEALWWDDASFPTGGPPLTDTSDFYIRVISDSLGNELERYLVVDYTTEDWIVSGFPIQVNEGDVFTFSFSFRTSDSHLGGVPGAYILLDNGTDQRYWVNTVWNTVTNPSGLFLSSTEDTNEWIFIEFTVGPIPFSGLVYLIPNIVSDTAENHYRDIRLEYTPMINQSTKITGHTHTSEQDINTKNKEDHEIFVDSSPKNSIIGTLYLDSTTGLLQDRTNKWTRLNQSEERNLGDIITFEKLFLRKEPRTLLEGTFYGLVSSENVHLSILSLIRYTLFPTRNFVPGRFETDYRNNRASGTLYDMYKDTDTDGDLTEIYTFQYLYK